MARTVQVLITGDSTQLRREFVVAEREARRFASSVSQSAGAAKALVAPTVGRQTTAAFTEVQSATRKTADSVKQSTAAISSDLEKSGGAMDAFRVKTRRAQAVGPFRLAGIGLGAGLGLLAATQAVAALGDALQVTGDKAFTTEGRMRNFTSSLLGGDIVGAIGSLTRGRQSLADFGIEGLFTGKDADAATNLTKHIKELGLVADGTADAMKRWASHLMENSETADQGAEIFQRYTQIVKAAGTASQDAAIAALNEANAWIALNTAAAQTIPTLIGLTDAHGNLIKELQNPLQPLAPQPLKPGTFGVSTGALVLSPDQKRELRLIGETGLERVPDLVARIGAAQARNRSLERSGNLATAAGQAKYMANLTIIANTEKEITGLKETAAASAAAEAESRKAAAKAAREASAAAVAAARDARQFLAIGLGPTGGQLAPPIGALRSQFARLDAAGLIPKRLREGIAKALFDPQGMSEALRLAYASAFADFQTDAHTKAVQRDFRELGRDPLTGEKRTPGRANLLKQTAQLLSRDDLSKGQRAEVLNVRKWLLGTKKPTEEGRKIGLEIIQGVRSGINQDKSDLDPVAFAGINTNKFIKQWGKGLSPDQIRNIRTGLLPIDVKGRKIVPGPGFGTFGESTFAGKEKPIEIKTTVMLDREKIGQSMERFRAQIAGRDKKQKRGPNAGR